MQQRYILILIILTLTMFMSCKEDTENLRGKFMGQLVFREFYEKVKDSGLEDQYLEAVVLNQNLKSEESGKRFGYVELVMFYGDDEIKSTYQILYNTEKTVKIAVNLKNEIWNIEVPWRKLRPRVTPAYQKEYNQNDKDTAPPAVKECLEKGNKRVLFAEYGLVTEKKYSIKFREESYRLPPQPPDMEPVKRTNLVLEFTELGSDNTQKSELTPLFSEWTY